MPHFLLKLWDDDCGSALLSSELLFIFAILVLGIISGLVAVRQAVVSELVETAQGIMSLNQSFDFSGQSNCESSTAGSAAIDFGKLQSPGCACKAKGGNFCFPIADTAEARKDCNNTTGCLVVKNCDAIVLGADASEGDVNQSPCE